MSNGPVARVAALLGGQLTAASYAGGWALVRAMPEGMAVRLFDAGADLAWRRGGRGVHQLRRNLQRVAPDADLDALTRAGLRSYARYWREVFRLPVTPLRRLVEGHEVHGEAHLRTAVASGRGVVMALPHSGNWDQAGAWLVSTGVPFTTVAERLRPAQLYDRFVAFREGLGMEVVPLTGGARPPSQVLTDRLRTGGALCLMADRDLTPRGIDVTLFGAATRMPAGPAALALATGATLLPAHLSFRPDGWRTRFGAPVAHTDVRRMSQDLMDAFAAGIAAAPADWHMLQRLWLEDLPADDPRREPR